MFLFIRNTLKKLLPPSVKYSLVRNLPNIEIFLANKFRGVEKLWENDQAFIKLYRELSRRSLLDIKKAYILYLCSKNAKQIEGEYAEFGVYKGAGSRLMLAGSEKLKKISLFDTFKGLPNISNAFDSNWKTGDLGDVNILEIKNFLNDTNFEFYPGFFPESSKKISTNKKFAFVHIDFDLYQSTLGALAYCYTRMTPSGIILIDDYGVLACEGVSKAVTEFFEDKPEMVVPNFNGQCIIVKK